MFKDFNRTLKGENCLEKNSFNLFMFRRYVGGSPGTVFVANLLNSNALSRLPNDLQCLVSKSLCGAVGGINPYSLKYLKKEK